MVDPNASVDKSTIDFESFHVSSNPVSRRASPVPLTDLSPSVPVSEAEKNDTVHSDLAESGYGSKAERHTHSIRSNTNPIAGHINSSRGSQNNPYARRATLPAAATLKSAGVVIPSTYAGPNEAWTDCVKMLREYDEHMIKGWKEDVDTLLVFAGLFSAVLTAFNIESYKFLQRDPEETAVAILKQISSQLSGAANETNTANINTFHPDARSVRINILWFSSLVLSLVSASIGILTKQWLREYISNTASSARESARIRQLRHESFVRWQIPLTIALLPILLQIAMALFFAGLLDLLWSLHPSVASVITVLVSISLAFLVLTTLMPTIRGDCPYKSPQAMGVFLLVQGLMRLVSLFAAKCYSWLGWDRRAWPIYVDTMLFRRRRRRFSGWLRSLIHKKYFGSWRERERAIVRESEAKLDHRILTNADATFMDDDFLERVVRPCMNDTETTAALDCLHEIITHRADGVVDGIPHWRHGEDVDCSINLLLHLVVDILPRIDHSDHKVIEKTIVVADHLCRAIPFETGHIDTVLLYQRLFEILALFLAHQEPVKRRSFDLMRSMWSRSSAPVQPVVIRSLTTFARAAKQANELDTFHLACEMALAFSTASNLPRVDFNSIRNELQLILEDLENYLTAPDSGVGTLGPGQSASILLALEELVDLDPDLLSAKMVRILDQLILEDGPRVTDSDSVASFVKRRIASAKALRKLRESRSRWQRPQRRNAIHVGGAADLDALNLELPKTPETQHAIGSAPQSPLELPSLQNILQPSIHRPSPSSHTYPIPEEDHSA